MPAETHSAASNASLPMVLTPLELAIDSGQRCIAAAPVIVLGSGASMPYGLPSMGDLREHLLTTVSHDGLDKEELKNFGLFRSVLSDTDLETALQRVPLCDRLMREVVRSTWRFIYNRDLAVFHQILEDRHKLALTRLFRHLFASTHTVIDVVTPNYDRLVEYAADVCGFSYYTGFAYGHLRSRQAGAHPLRLNQNGRPVRTVNIWKVHGSLDWFRDSSQNVIALPVTYKISDTLEPTIVTPGVEKYRRAHEEPFRSILTGADAALMAARAYLCVGYGFNDIHIHPKLVMRCQQDMVPIVILARHLSQAARDLLFRGDCRKFAAFEECDGGTRLFTPDHPTGVDIPGHALWQFDQFLTAVT